MAQLKEKMTLLFWRAWNGRDVRQHTYLRGGLQIHLYVTRGAEIHLLLGRTDVYPSDQEWTTVLSHWPVALPEPRPVPERAEKIRLPADGRLFFGLKAAWPMPQPQTWIRELPAQKEANP
jgi:hypothetical protein